MRCLHQITRGTHSLAFRDRSSSSETQPPARTAAVQHRLRCRGLGRRGLLACGTVSARPPRGLPEGFPGSWTHSSRVVLPLALGHVGRDLVHKSLGGHLEQLHAQLPRTGSGRGALQKVRSHHGTPRPQTLTGTGSHALLARARHEEVDGQQLSAGSHCCRAPTARPGKRPCREARKQDRGGLGKGAVGRCPRQAIGHGNSPAWQ